MRLKLSVGGRGEDRDVLVTADAAATVGDVAEELSRTLSATTGEIPGDMTIRVHGLLTDPAGTSPVLLDPKAPIGESPLPSGSRITLAPSSDLFDSQGHRRGDGKALLRIHAGPDDGREFTLPEGSTQVGRDASADVQLSDPFVSKRHIRISVTDVIEVIDLGSANGTSIGGEKVQRVAVRPNELIEIGDTMLSIRPLTRLKDGATSAVAFNRPPVVQRIFAAREIEAPEPPGPVRPTRFPIISLMGPLLVVAIMFTVTKIAPSAQRLNPIMFLMMGLSPLLMIGNFLDQRRTAKNETRVALAQFRASVEDLRTELEQLAQDERVSRFAEAPSTADGLASAETRGRMLWARRLDQSGFLELRLGIGRVTSRTTLKLPDRRRSKPEDWQSLAQLQGDFATIDGVPVVASLSESGGIGVAGPTDVMTVVARAIVAQIACLHSPAEVAMAAVGSSLSVGGWDWLKWLPHVGSPHSPIKDVSLADNATTASRLIAQLEEMMHARSERQSQASGADTIPLPRVVLIVMDDAPIERSRLVALAEQGPAVGLHILWFAGSVAQIPAACRSFIELDREGHAESGQVHLHEIVDPIRCESLDLEVALHLARRLAPVVDSGARIEDDSDLPRTVSFLASTGTELAQSPSAVSERWIANDPTLVGGAVRRGGYSLRAVVGQSAGDAFALDLRAHGPHALVGGTTGAGKSEFLQSWVLSLAASQSPRRVTFLFVDYKGGSAFARCTELPHCVGIVTDLDQHLVRRALTSLRAELTYREEVLAHYRAKDIIDLEKNPAAQQMPSLIIVVDEFAALAQEIPEFVDGVIDVAQRGRSLGLHLVLATQRPSGVIKGNLRANTNLRVALRMADADDSVDVLGDPMSATFDPAIPGRAAAKTGPGRITVFQSLYVGGSTPDIAPRPSVDVESLSFGAASRLTGPDSGAPVEDSEPETDLNRTVDQIIGAARTLEIPEPRKPWLPVLADVYDFAMLPQRTDAELIIGMQDLPQQQSNQLVYFRPDIDGNMAIIGTGGSGKSTALRTLAVAAAGTVRGGPCDVYALDFGSRGLSMLADLPHVGAVISGTDHERVGRLLRWLRDEVDARARRYADVNAATIGEYRERSGRKDEQRILVLLDGLPAFRQEYELGPRNGYYTLFGQLAADGRAVGVHFVITADRPAAVPASLAATIQQRLVLRLSDQNDYSLAGVPADVLSADSPPGRGLLDGLEVQVAVLGASASLPRQAEDTDHLAELLQARGRTPARPIERLAERVALSELPASSGGGAVIGIGDDDLQPFAIEPQGTFLVVGPPSSGRTTTLAALAQAVRRHAPDATSYLFAGRRTGLRNADSWAGTGTSDEEIEELVNDLTYRISAGDLGPTPDRPVVIVIEGLDSFASTSSEPLLEGLVKVAADHGALVIGESETSALSQSYMLGGLFKQGRRGLILQPDDVDGQTVFKQNFPRSSRSEFPPGRGMVVDAGRAMRVQVCLPE